MNHTKSALLSFLLLSFLLCVSSHHVEGHVGGYSIQQIWAFGIVASFGISLLAVILSTIMIVLLRTKLSSNKRVKLIVITLTAFAIGALLGDCIVHIIPQIYGARTHDILEEEGITGRMLHGDEDHETEAEIEEEIAYVENEPKPTASITSLLILIGFGAFIVLEKVFDLIGAPNPQGFQEVQMNDNQVKYVEAAKSDVAVPIVNKEVPEAVAFSRQDSVSSQSVPVQANMSQNRALSFSQKLFSLKGRKSAGKIILLTNFFHNIVDGLAIGGTFSTGNKDVAITTFIAVLAHQIPHGIGDMGSLLEANFPITQALLWRGLFNFSTLIGAAIGLRAGLIDDVSSAYLLGFVTGNLLYISLVNMVPAVMKQSKGSRAITYLLAFAVGAGFPFALLTVE